MIHKLLAGKGKMKRGLSLLLCLALLGSSVISSNVTAEAESEVAVDVVETVETEETLEVVETETEEENVSETAEEVMAAGEELSMGVAADESEGPAAEAADPVAEDETISSSGNIGESVAAEVEPSVPEKANKENESAVEMYFEQSVDGVTVTAIAEAGAFDETPVMSVMVLEAEGDTAVQYSKAEAALNESNVSYDGFIAFDISFTDIDGNEVEPADGHSISVSLSMENILSDVDIDPESLEVHHLAETGSGLVAEMVADTADNVDGIVETAKDGTVSAEFTVNSFSTFTVTYSYSSLNEGTLNAPNLTVYLIDENGNEIDIGVLESVDASSGWNEIKLIAEDYISQVKTSGYTYEGAYNEKNDSTKITYIKYSTGGLFSNSGWKYSAADSEPNSWANGSDLSNNTIYLKFSSTSSGGSTEEPENITPGYSKYVSDNRDGTYDLTLTVTGGISQTSSKVKLDIIYVLDVSGSMEKNMGSKTRLYYATGAIKTMTESLAGNTALDVQYALVTFSGSRNDGSYNDANIIQSWTNNSNTLIDCLPTSAKGGTNYEAGLVEAENLLKADKARSDAITVVVFISDGDVGYYYDSYGNTTGSGSGYNATAYQEAGSQLSSMDMDYFISVGVGDSSNYSRLKSFGETYSKASIGTYYYEGTDETSLENAFKSIQSIITTYAFSDVTIEDTLSDNVTIVENESNEVDLKITITDENGESIATGTGNVEIPNSKVVITASYDSETGKIKLNFPEDYKLEDGWTYAVTGTIKASDAAYTSYQTNGGYTDTGDAGTDAPGVEEDAYISSEKKGVYTNKEATLTYTYNGEVKTIDYPKPVIPLQVGNLVIEKKIDGLDENEISTLLSTLTFSYKLGTDEAMTVRLSSENYDSTTGTYKYTIFGIKAGTSYGVTESNADVDGYDLSETSSNENGTIEEDKNITASFVNSYKKSTNDLTITKAVNDDFTGDVSGISYGFTVKSEDGTLSGTFNYTNGTSTGTITFEDGTSEEVAIIGTGSLTIKDLPVGTYTVTESTPTADPEGWYFDTTTTMVGSATLSKGTNGAGSVTITNNYIKYKTITVNKTVTGNMGDKDKSFSFTVLVNNTQQETETLSHGGSFVISNLKKGDVVSISEVDYSEDGYTTYVTVGNGGEALGSSYYTTISDSDVEITFRNDRNVNTPTGIVRNVFPYALAMVIALCGSVVMFALTRRKRN